MASFIARIIKAKSDCSTADGKNKYRQYFINTLRYLKYKDEVDIILNSDGYANIILKEEIQWT